MIKQQEMNYVIKHTQCPQCRKNGKDNHKDNLALYFDGSEYCFSCGYYKNKTILKQIEIHKPNIIFPFDSQSIFPQTETFWLTKYLTDYEIKKHLICWSPYWKRICIPLIQNNIFIGWLGRSLIKKPKWLLFKAKEKINYLLGDIESTTIVLTEDIISAIIVSRQPNICVMPLFGSILTTSLIQNLKYIYRKETIIIWLDKDKEKDVLTYKYKFNQLDYNIKSIVSIKDPKEYNDEEIKTFLYNASNNKTIM